jgi:hypothetical protein
LSQLPAQAEERADDLKMTIVHDQLRISELISNVQEMHIAFSIYRLSDDTDKTSGVCCVKYTNRHFKCLHLQFFFWKKKISRVLNLGTIREERRQKCYVLQTYHTFLFITLNQHAVVIYPRWITLVIYHCNTLTSSLVYKTNFWLI